MICSCRATKFELSLQALQHKSCSRCDTPVKLTLNETTRKKLLTFQLQKKRFRLCTIPVIFLQHRDLCEAAPVIGGWSAHPCHVRSACDAVVGAVMRSPYNGIVMMCRKHAFGIDMYREGKAKFKPSENGRWNAVVFRLIGNTIFFLYVQVLWCVTLISLDATLGF